MCWNTLHAYRRPTSTDNHRHDLRSASHVWQSCPVQLACCGNICPISRQNFLPNSVIDCRIQLFRQRGDLSGRRIFHQRLGVQKGKPCHSFPNAFVCFLFERTKALTPTTLQVLVSRSCCFAGFRFADRIQYACSGITGVCQRRGLPQPDRRA